MCQHIILRHLYIIILVLQERKATQSSKLVCVILLLLVSVNFSYTRSGPGGVPGGGVPAKLGVRLAKRGGRAPATGRRRAGEEEGETGRASQANPGRGGQTD